LAFVGEDTEEEGTIRLYGLSSDKNL